jgi:uncharacterized iron-regulated protein
MRYSFLVLSIVTLCAVPASVKAQSGVDVATPTAGGYTAHRVYDAKRKRFTDFESMLKELAKADVVFLGEQHDDPRTHQLEEAVLEGIARRRTAPMLLALEMFERDAQAPLDAYLTGSKSEPEFLALARPWPNYRTDYRPMVEFARDKGWPVIAGNVPRRLASVVSRGGLAALDTIPPSDRAMVAKDLSCPRDGYWKRFRATMGDMSGHGMTLTPEQLEATVWRVYQAQCIKDETMGEAIATAHESHQALVVHANGSFHSDYRLGTAERVRRRLPKAKIAVVSFVPVADLDNVNGKSHRKLGNWVVFTLETPKPAPATPATTPQPAPKPTPE